LRDAFHQGKLRAVTLRILHVDTERGWRGGERQTLWLAAELARRGHVSVIAARPGEPLAARAAGVGLDVVYCAPGSEVDVRAAWRLRRAVRERDIQLVHAHTAHAVAVAAMATLGFEVPMIVARRVDFALRRNVGTRWKYGRAARIIAVSNAVAGVLERSGVPDEQIRVVPDGVDVHRTVSAAPPATLRALGIRAGAPLVVQVAQLVGHKDPVNFVRAMARVRDRVPSAMGLLVGDGPLRADVEREVTALGLDDVVRLAGYRTDADALLAAAQVACLSSREEGMGSVLLDALAFGVPVAATSAGGIPEVVVHGESGLLAAPENPAALGDAIATLLEDSGLCARLAQNARTRSREFSVERMTDRTIAVYEEALSGTGAGRRSRTSAASSSSSA
jgi:glycosyltransferase involved in cell wall biosynthesis